MVVFSPYTTSSWSIYAWVVVVAFSLSTLLCRCCCFSLFAIVCFFITNSCVSFSHLSLLFLTSDLICCCCCLFAVVVVDDIVVICFFFLLLHSFLYLSICFSRVSAAVNCVLFLLFYINYEFGWINFHLRSSNSKFQVKQNVALQLATVYLCAVGIGRLIVICSVFCYTYKYTMLKSFRLHSYFFSLLTGKILSSINTFLFAIIFILVCSARNYKFQSATEIYSHFIIVIVTIKYMYARWFSACI